MSTYTMTLGECFDMWVGRETSNTRDKIEAGRTKLFDFDYPIFDEDYKKVFETHFIRKFYMREIGFETEGAFKFHLESWLLINMPYFNKLFESEKLEFDPLTNTKIDTTHNRKNDKNQDTTSKTTGSSSSNNSQTASGTTTTDNFGRHLESDTPDTRLAITTNDGQGVIEYASQIQENTENDKKTSSSSTSGNSSDKSDVTNTGNATINETEDYIESKFGKVGTQTYSSMVNEYRSSLLRIENKIFEEMQELFMMVY